MSSTKAFAPSSPNSFYLPEEAERISLHDAFDRRRQTDRIDGPLKTPGRGPYSYERYEMSPSDPTDLQPLVRAQ